MSSAFNLILYGTANKKKFVRNDQHSGRPTQEPTWAPVGPSPARSPTPEINVIIATDHPGYSGEPTGKDISQIIANGTVGRAPFNVGLGLTGQISEHPSVQIVKTLRPHVFHGTPHAAGFQHSDKVTQLAQLRGALRSNEGRACSCFRLQRIALGGKGRR